MGTVGRSPTGLKICFNTPNPGLAPWAMQEYRPLGAHCPTAPIKSHKQSLTTTHTITIKQIHERTQQSIDTPNTFNEHNTTTQHRKRPIRQRALQGRHSCKAQGGMRAKPDMEPWVNADKSRLSSVGAALTHTSICLTSRKCRPSSGLNKCIPMINPGLAPWAMQEYRPVGTHCPNTTIHLHTPNNPQYHTPIQKHERMQQSIDTPKHI